MAFNNKNPTSVVPKPNVEAMIHGSTSLDDKGGMKGRGEWLNGEYENRHLPLTWKQGRAVKKIIEDKIRRRACKGSQETGAEYKDGEEDEEEDEEEEEDEDEDEDEEEDDSDSDWADSEGFTHDGRAQPVLKVGHLCIDRDHEDFNAARRDDEHVHMNVLESADGWFTINGFSTTTRGRLDLKGFINPAGTMYVFKAEDIVDTTESSAKLEGKAMKSAVRRRVKFTKPSRMPVPASGTPLNRRPQHISGKNSSQNWTILRAHRELATNLIDQAKVTLKKVYPFNTPRLEPPKITRNDNGETKVVFFARSVKLAEILFQEKITKWVRSYELVKTRYKAEDVIDPCHTWVLSYINYEASILPKHLLRGESGHEKAKDLSLTGKFGDGLTSSADYLVRRGCNFSLTTGGYTEVGGFTARCILDKDGSSYFQLEPNKQSEHRVVIRLAFMPNTWETADEYYSMYTAHGREPFDPETFDPMSFYLPVNVDAVFVETHGPGSDPSAILMDDNMRGMMHNRGFWVAEMGSCEYLFGYDFADPKRTMIEGRDRGAMNAKVTRPEIDRLLSGGIKRSPRIRRRVLLKLTRGSIWKNHEDVRPQNWSEEVIKLLQQESRTMYPGTVLVNSPTPIIMLVVGLRGLERIRCNAYLDEGPALVDAFVDELRSLPQETIRPDDAGAGWARVVRDDLLRITGAKEMAAVEFPGKLGEKHAVWVEEDVVLISRRSLSVSLGQEDAKTAKFLLDVISCSMERELSFAKLSDRVFEVYHLIMSAVYPEEGTASAVTGAPALDNGHAQGFVESRDNARQRDLETMDAPSNAPLPTPTPATIAGEETNQESVEKYQAEAAAEEESSEESDGVGDESIEDVEGEGGGGGATTTPSGNSTPGGGKRTNRNVSEEDAVGEGAAKRQKHEVLKAGQGRAGDHRVKSDQTESVTMISSSLSVKVGPRSSEELTSPVPQQLNDGAGQVADRTVEGNGGSQEPEEKSEGAPTAVANARSGEELEAFFAEGGVLVPALGHILQHALDDGDGNVNLYRIVGRKDNLERACERFTAVVANERVRRVLEFAVKQPGVDISFFCWGEPGALRGFVGHTGRVFINLASSKTIDDWAKDDLPTTLAHEVAHARSSTPCNVHSHPWSMEFREWVRSEEF